MRIAVTKIVSSVDSGCIFVGEVLDFGHPREGQSIKVKAGGKVMLGMPAVDETWDVDGPFKPSKYGEQLEAARAVRCLPSGKLIRNFLASHLPGIGAERAQRLWDAFGTDLGAMLESEDNIDLVAKVIAPDRPLLSVSLATAAIREWKQAVAETRLVEWLMRQGIEDIGSAVRIGRVLGPHAVERLSANPYMLVPLLPWSKLDALGVRILAGLGVPQPRQDNRRLVGAVDAAVKHEIGRHGHTALPDAELRRGVARLLGVKEGSALADRAVKVGARNGAILPWPGHGGWRFPGCALLEDGVVAKLRTMQAGSTPPIQIPAPEALRRVLKGLLTGERRLHTEQTEAVLQAIQRPVACLQGGAGVGKTHTTRAICDLWEHLGGGVVLCALAGKAALKLSKSTGRLARTVTRLLAELDERDEVEATLLGTDLSNAERAKLRKRQVALPRITSETLLIIDEASMVDLPTMHRLLRRLPDGARFLMVGDEAQLPPIGFGLVYQKMVRDPGITSVLSVVHRQTDASGIPDVARAIRDRRMPSFAPYHGSGGGVSFVQADDMSTAVRRIAAELGGFRDGRLLIVTATNDGDAGIAELNAMFHGEHVAAASVSEIKGHLKQSFSPGDPVIHLRNAYKLSLFNGSLGTVKRIDSQARSLVAEFDEREILFTTYDTRTKKREDTGQLIDLALAYAITCHKCQGSAAERVIIPVYRSTLLDPSWLYTAVTRAVEQAVLVGDIASLRQALSRPWKSQERHVAFEWRA